MVSKKQTMVVLLPKTDKGKEKLSYHGDKWYLRDEVDSPKFDRTKGACLVLRSRDGTKVLFIQKENDPDFTYRKV